MNPPLRQAHDLNENPSPGNPFARRVIAWVTLVTYLGQPLAVMAQVVADPSAAPQNRPLIDNTANGLPLVQITTPSAAGVSHNQYSQFNVAPSGLILNNSTNPVTSQQGGYALGNPNLANGSARIILNEVTGTGRSSLRGYTEVAGARAEVIIANPNGISCDGCGFVNTSRGILTTGIPVMGGGGSLNAFRVTGGQIDIGAAGLNSSNLGQLDLIARSVKVNGSIWANELNVITGANQVNYAGSGVQLIAGDANKPTVGIDVALLGGMYANKISLIGSEAGVGVNSLGSFAAQAGDFTLDNVGRITLNGNTSATGNLTITGNQGFSQGGTLYSQQNTRISNVGDIRNSGTLAAQGALALTGANIHVSGTLGAGINPAGNATQNSPMSLTATGNIATAGQNLAGGDIVLNGGIINLANSQTNAGGSATLNAAAGNIDLGNGQLQSFGTATLNASGAVINNGGTLSTSQLNLSAASLINRGSTIDQRGAGAAVITVTGLFDNTGGNLSSGGGLNITTGDLNNQGGTVVSTASTDIRNTGGISNSQGSIESGAGLTINSSSVNNTAGRLVSLNGDGLTLNTTGEVANTRGITATGASGGLIGGNGAVDINAGSIRNTASIVANTTLGITATTIDNRGGQFNAQTRASLTGALDNSAGGFIGADSLTLIAVNARINNRTGTIQSNNGLSMNAGNLSNAGGSIQNLGAAALNLKLGQSLNNNVLNGKAGFIGGNGTVTITATSANNNGGSIYGKGRLTLSSAGLLSNQGGLVRGDSQLTVSAAGALNNIGGNIEAGGALNVNSARLDNSAGRVVSLNRDGLSINTRGQLVNASGTTAMGDSGGLIGGNGTVTIAAGSIRNAGSVVASNDLTGRARSTLDNSGGSLVSGGALTASATNTLSNNNGSINADQLTLTADNLSNRAGSITQTGTAATTLAVNNLLDNTRGTITSNSTELSLTPQTLDNTNGIIAHAGSGTLAITATTLNNTGGSIATNGALLIRATTDNIGGRLSAQQNASLSGILDNSAGGFIGADWLSLNAISINNIAGAIQSNSGLSLIAGILNNAGGSIHNLGTTALDLNIGQSLNNTALNGTAGFIGGNGTVTITAATADNSGGSIYAKDTLNLSSASRLDNRGGLLQSGADVILRAAGALNNTGGSIDSAGLLDLNASSVDNSSGSIDAAQLTLTAIDLSNRSGKITQIGTAKTTLAVQNTLDNTAGNIASNSTDLVLTPKNLNNDNGSISHAGAGTLAISTGALSNIGGSIATNGTASITATTIDNRGGQLSAQKSARLTSALNNSAGGFIGADSLNLNAANTRINNNAGAIQSNNGVSLIAADLTNAGGSIQNLGAAALDITLGQSLSNTALNGTAGFIGGNGTVTIAAATADNGGGSIYAKDTLSLTSGSLLGNRGGLVRGGANVALRATGALDNTGGTVESAGQLELNTSSLDNSGGSMSSTGASNITSGGALSNTRGSIEAGGALAVNSSSLDNRAGRLVSLNGDGLSINNSGQLTNASGTTATGAAGGLIGGNGAVRITAGSIGNSASIVASNDLGIIAAAALDNSGGSLASGGALNAAAATTLSNVGGRIDGGTVVTLNAARLNNNNGSIAAAQLTLTAADLSNRTGRIAQTGTATTTLAVQNTLDNTGGNIASNSTALSLTPQTLNNTNGTIAHAGAGTLTITTAALNNIGGNIGSNGTLNISAATDNRGGQLSAQQSARLSGTLDNSAGGFIRANSLAVIAANARINNRNGTMQSRSRFNLNALNLNNNGGTINNLGAAALNINLGQSLSNLATGFIGGNGAVNVAAASVNNSGGRIYGKTGLNLSSTGQLTNSSGLLRGDGSLTVQVAGALNNSGGGIEANGSANVSAASISNGAGHIDNIGSGITRVSSTGQINNSGALIGGNGSTEINASSLTNTGAGRVIAGGNLVLNTRSLLNNSHGTLYAAGNLSMVQTGASINNYAGSIGAAGNLVLSSSSLNNNYGLIANLANGTGDTTLRSSRNISNTGGRIGSARDLSLTTNSLLGSGKIVGGRDAAIRLQGNYVNTGGLPFSANRNLTFSVSGSFTNQSTLQAVGGLTLNAASINNLPTGRINSSVTTLNTSGNIDNSGRIEGGSIIADSLNFNNVKTVMGGNITLRNGNMFNHGVNAVIAATTMLNLFSQNALTNFDGATLYSLGDLNIGANSALYANGYLANNTSSVSNSSATIEAGGKLRVSANQITNKRSSIGFEWGPQWTGASVGTAASFSHLVSPLAWGTQIEVGVNPGIAYWIKNGILQGAKFIQATLSTPTPWPYRSRFDPWKSILPLGTSVAGTFGYTPYFQREQLSAGNTAQSQMLSGGDMWLKGNIDNQYSSIASGRNLAFNANMVTQTSHTLMQRETDIGQQSNWALGYYTFTNIKGKLRYMHAWANSIIPYNVESFTPIGSVNASMTANNRITGTAININNQTVTGVNGMVGSSAASLNAPQTIVSINGRASQTVAPSAANNNSVTRVSASQTSRTLAQSSSRVTGSTNQAVSASTSSANTPRLSASQTGNLSIVASAATGNTSTRVSASQTSKQQSRVDGGVTRGDQTVTRTVSTGGSSNSSTGIQLGAPHTPTNPLPSFTTLPGFGLQSTETVAINVPDNGLFTTHTGPSQDYLVTTDPRFTDFKTFISSDYMASRLSMDPQRIQKRLGDGFYEQKLITDQINQLTGRRYLGQYESSEDQFKALMDSGIQVSEAFNLVPGISLSAEQMAALTTDMVWMVEREVTLADGSTRRVLVPTVYLSRQHKYELSVNGSLIAANEIDLNIADTLVNSGTIMGAGSTVITATDIFNRGGYLGGGDTTLTARNDILNLSGNIIGTNVAMVAGRDIRIERVIKEVQHGAFNGALVSREAGVNATGTLSIISGRDLSVSAASINAGGDTTLFARRDLNIGTVAASQRTEAHQLSKVGNFGEVYRVGGSARTVQFASRINTGGKLTLGANNDIGLRAVDIVAGGDVAVIARGDLAITTASTLAQVTGRPDAFKRVTHLVSSIKAGGNLSLDAGPLEAAQGMGNIKITAAKLEAGQALNVVAGGNLTLDSIKDSVSSQYSQQNTNGKLDFIRAQGSNYDETLKGASLIAGSGIALTAGSGQHGNILLEAARLASQSGEVALTAGNIEIGSASEQHQSNSQSTKLTIKRLKSVGKNRIFLETTDNKTDFNKLVGSSITGGSININSGQDIRIKGSFLASMGDLQLDAGRNVSIESQIASGSQSRYTDRTHHADSATQTALAAGLTAGGALAIKSGQNINIAGTRIDAGGNATLNAGGDLSLKTVVINHSSSSQNGTISRSASSTLNLLSQIKAGGDIGLSAGILKQAGGKRGNINLTSANMDAGQKLRVVAGGNVTLDSSKDSVSSNYDAGYKVSKRTGETVKGSRLSAVDAILLEAGKSALTDVANRANLSLVAASVESKKGSVTLDATGDVSLATANEHHQSMDQTITSGGGLFSSSTTTVRDTSSRNDAIGSSISGDSITINSGNSINISGSDVAGTRDVSLKAGADININAATSDYQLSHYAHTEESGLMSNGGLSITLGSRSQTDRSNVNGVIQSQSRSLVGSINGNLNITAGGNATVSGSDVIAAHDINIVAENVTIDTGFDQNTQTQSHDAQQSGITLALTSPVLSAIEAAQKMQKAKKKVKSGRHKALADVLTLNSLMGAYGAVKNGQQVLNDKGVDVTNNADRMGGINVSISLGSSSRHSESKQTRNQAVKSLVSAGNNVNITAGSKLADSATPANADTAATGNITIIGSEIRAINDTSLTADKQLDLLAATNTATQVSSNTSDSASAGIGFSLGGGSNGFTINLDMSSARGNADGRDVSYSNTHLTAGNGLTLKSGGDTNLIGAVAAGNQVTADIGGDLNIESLQDISSYTSEQKSSGVSLSLCIPPLCYGMSGASVSGGGSNANSNYASVTEQSGIMAGSNGFQVTVQNNTDLKGAVIASNDQAIADNKNTFTSGGSVSQSDIQNRASFEANASSFSAGVGSKLGASGGMGNDSGNANSTTKSGIDVSTNTDTTGAITPIFDSNAVMADVNAQVQITQAFSQAAPRAVASFASTRQTDLENQAKTAAKAGDKVKADKLNAEAKKWGEGGRYRIALHTIAGALGGGGSGALGAAVSASAAPLLTELQTKVTTALIDQGLSPEIAILLGQGFAEATSAGAGAVVGGTQGAMTGVSVDTNNRQLHFAETQRIKDLAVGDPKVEARLTAAACALVHCADGVPKSDPAYGYLTSLQNAGAKLIEEKNLLSQQKGWDGLIRGSLFQYSGFDQYITDPFTQNKAGTRLIGTVQALGGAATTFAGASIAAGGIATCAETGVGCLFAAGGTAIAGYGWDMTTAGTNTAYTGNPTRTYGEQVLDSLGMSSQAASVTYALLGLSPAAAPAITQTVTKLMPQLDAILLNVQAKLGQNVDDMAASLAASSTKISGAAGRVVLGKWQGNYAGYVGEAKLNGGIWYQTDPGVFEKLTAGLTKTEAQAVAWKVNETFLTQQMQKGISSIEFTGITVADIKVGPPSFALMEVQFLEINAAKYGYQKVGNAWVKVK